MNGKFALLAAVLSLAACRDAENTQADGRMLWDRDGCGYYVRAGIGDTSFIKRVPDADKSSCVQRAERGAATDA